MKKWTLLLCAIACLSSINTATAKVLTLEEVDNGQLHDGLVPYTSWPFFVFGAALLVLSRSGPRFT